MGVTYWGFICSPTVRLKYIRAVKAGMSVSLSNLFVLCEVACDGNGVVTEADNSNFGDQIFGTVTASLFPWGRFRFGLFSVRPEGFCLPSWMLLPVVWCHAVLAHSDENRLV